MTSKQYESTPDLPGALAHANGSEKTSEFSLATYVDRI
jgi:hypothetical protein